MKKLISILLMLLMLLGCVALAENDENLVSGSDETVETVQEQEPAAEEPVEEPAQQDAEDDSEAAKESEAASTSSWKDKRLSTKGLIVTAGGLAGTFLVLILFFLAIKLMGKMLNASSDTDSSKRKA